MSCEDTERPNILVIDEEPLDIDSIPQMNVYRPGIIALSSGGTKGLGQVGTISVLYDEGVLNGVETYIGTSVGGAIALMLTVGCTPHEILEVAIRTTILKPWSQLNKLDKVLISEYGFVPYTTAVAPMRGLVERKMGGRIPTLLELYEETGIHLVFVTGNLTDRRVEYLDHINHPTLPCVDALTMSMLIPGLISKFRYQGKLWVDGAFVDPYPLHYFDNGSNEILGIAVIGTEIDPEGGYFSYMYAAMTLLSDRLQELSGKTLSSKARSIELHLPEISILDRARDINKRLQCYNAGVLAGKKAVASFYGKTYEEYYGVSALPTKYVAAPTFEIKPKHKQPHGSRPPPNRFANALGRIPVPHLG